MNWQEESLFFNGDAYFDDLIGALDRADRSIELETYIFDDDQTGQNVADALARAAKRGVTTRLLVDGIGASTWVGKKAPHLREQGVMVRVYHPVHWANLLSRLFMDLGLKRSSARKGSALLARLNRRDHRKMTIVDGDAAWVGSINVSDSHCGRRVGSKAWRDTGVRVRGEAVFELQAAFDHAWNRAKGPGDLKKRKLASKLREGLRRLRGPKVSHPLVKLNYTTRLRRRNHRAFLDSLQNATSRIWITNAYLAPSTPVMAQLIQAARRGVEVKLLVPRTSDVFFMPWVASAHYRPLLSNGVRIFEYLPRFLHAKSVIIDQTGTVGSSNMNRRSLLHDFEVDVVLTQEKTIRSLSTAFENDLRESEEIRLEKFGFGAWASSLAGRAFTFFLKHWI